MSRRPRVSAVALLASICLGMAAEAVTVEGAGAAGSPEPAGYWGGDADAPTPATLSGGTVVHLDGLDALLNRADTVVVDVSNTPRRPAELAPGAPWLPLPHRAIPRASWLPGVGAAVLTQDMDDFYRSRLARATAGNVDAAVVIYCHEKCWLSWNAAKRAIGYGYRRVHWFPEGIEGWTAAGRPTVVAAPQGPAVATPASDTAPASDSAPASATAPASGKPAGPAAQDSAARPALVVLDLELTGDLGGPEFAAEHDARLRTETARLRRDLERTGMYRLLDNGAAQEMIDTLKSQQSFLHDCNGCDLPVGRTLHADLVLVAWVYRVSGLILTLTYEIHDVRSGQITARKSFDFRGDNDNAWNHAIDYMVRDLAKQ